MQLFFLTAALCYQNALFYHAPHYTDTGFQIRPARPDLALEELNEGLKFDEDPLYFSLLRARAKTYEILGELQKAENDWTFLTRKAPSGDLKEEALFALASAAFARHDLLQTRRSLEQMASYYQAASITRGAYLSRFYLLQALLHQEEGALEEALLFFAEAEETSRGSMLPTDEKLKLWIAYGKAYKEAGHPEKAREWFTRAFQEEVISSERLVAKQHLDQLEASP